MSEEIVEITRRAYEGFIATQEFNAELIHPEFVWDMSTFRGWPERQTYAGVEGAREFMDNWLETWDDWELELEELRDAGDSVVGVIRQRGRSRATGLPVDMHFAQVWTYRDGLQIRMRMYASPEEALRAAGLGD
jgi:ketosteroid isomerase-like protein